ncbi:MAG: hypothetical protein ABWX67_02880 [Allosphingosinicella sp.]
MDRREFLVGATAAGLLPLAPAQAAGTCYPDGSCEVGIPNISMTATQRCEQWCWAASIQAVFGLYGYRLDQTVIVRKLFGDLRCMPTSNQQLYNAINGQWIDAYGRRFRAQAQVIWDPSIGMTNPNTFQIVYSDLYAGRPLISGAVGHATVVTAVRYWPTRPAPQLIYVTVRDPWPYSPNRRTLRPDEVAGTQFLTRILVG